MSAFIKPLLAALTIFTAVGAVSGQQVDPSSGSVVGTVANLEPGQFVWAPRIAPDGPMLLIVNTTTQRAILYRNGIPIGATTVSTGRPGYRTPTGVFTVLQKHVEHYSNKYDNAPMPYMQRLTWYGIALHAGQLPGYPASHGCIRLPLGFARLLYGVTKLGMTVVVTDEAVTPRIAATPAIAVSSEASPAVPNTMEWHPEKSPSGPVSIIVSAADRRAIVLRNGIEIGSAFVGVEGAVSGTWAYALRSIDDEGQHWVKISISPDANVDQHVQREEWKQFRAPEEFKKAVASIVQPGTTVVVTPDSLNASAAGAPVTVIENEEPEETVRPR